MGWLKQEEFEECRSKALALTKEQRQQLSWEDARKLVYQDTLAIAAFGLVYNAGGTPWQAVVRANLLPDNC